MASRASHTCLITCYVRLRERTYSSSPLRSKCSDADGGDESVLPWRRRVASSCSDTSAGCIETDAASLSNTSTRSFRQSSHARLDLMMVAVTWSDGPEAGRQLSARVGEASRSDLARNENTNFAVG